MTKNKQLEVANYCYALVSGMFANFHNPIFRGSKFVWSEFPELVSELAEVQVFTSVTMNKNNKAEIERKASEFAREIASNLVQNAGYN